MRWIFGAVTAMALTWGVPVTAQETFPTRPVTIVVPYTAGGPSDLLARILADELTKVWNQPVLIENKPGGGTVVALAATAHAEPDGYTMIETSPAFVINPAVRSSMPYDAEKDFRGVSLFVGSPSAIVAHPGFAPNTLAEMVEEAKKRDPSNPVTYAALLGSGTHMTMELLQLRTGVKFKAIPYQGSADALPDTLAGRVDSNIAIVGDILPLVKSGQLKIISLVYPERLSSLPDTPTALEEFPELQDDPMGSWNAIHVPAGVPDDILKQIAEGFEKATNSESYKQRVREFDSFPRYTTPEETDAFISHEIATWKEVAAASGIKID